MLYTRLTPPYEIRKSYRLFSSSMNRPSQPPSLSLRCDLTTWATWDTCWSVRAGTGVDERGATRLAEALKWNTTLVTLELTCVLLSPFVLVAWMMLNLFWESVFFPWSWQIVEWTPHVSDPRPWTVHAQITDHLGAVRRSLQLPSTLEFTFKLNEKRKSGSSLSPNKRSPLSPPSDRPVMTDFWCYPQGKTRKLYCAPEAR